MKNEKMKLFAVVMLGLALAGCGKSRPDADTSGEKKTAEKDEDASDDKKLTPEERQYLAAAKPFAISIANRKYDEAYRQLTGYATARMSLNQFSPEDDEAKFALNEKNAMANVTGGQFAELMKKSEERFGTPKSLKQFYVFSQDPKAMDHTGKQGFEALDAMFAIGNMPDSVPVGIRRASIRGKIATQLSPQELEKVAKQEGMTVEELQKHPDFETYFTIKLVMIEQDGQLKVGYFEFLPPGIMD